VTQGGTWQGVRTGSLWLPSSSESSFNFMTVLNRQLQTGEPTTVSGYLEEIQAYSIDVR